MKSSINEITNRISSILYDGGFSNLTVLQVLSRYNDKSRKYHDLFHIGEMLDFVSPFSNRFSMNEWEALQYAIIFHDVVYNTKSHTNEADSYKFFYHAWFHTITEVNKDLPKWKAIIPMVEEMILATKDHTFSADLPIYTQLIIEADLERLTGPFEAFWNNTLRLMKEYAFVDWADFKKGRLKFFLEYGPKVAFLGPDAMNNINLAYHTLKVWEPKIGVMIGTWDPWHVGHQKMYDDACEIFDKVIIARGQNTTKPPHTFPMPDCILETCQVDSYSGSVVDYLNSKSYPVTLIRSIRNQNDLTNEIAFCQWIQDKKPEQKYIFLATHPSVAHVSSSMCREERKINGNTKTQYEI